MTFQIHGLPKIDFEFLFGLSDQDLKAHMAVRSVVAECPGTPCRVSLEDAKVGEEVILVHHMHQTADTPYRASHAVFVRKGMEQAFLAVGEIPELFLHRLMSLRAFDKNNMMIDAEAVLGTNLGQAVDVLFAMPQTEYIHLHYAKPGCYAACVSRA